MIALQKKRTNRSVLGNPNRNLDAIIIGRAQLTHKGTGPSAPFDQTIEAHPDPEPKNVQMPQGKVGVRILELHGRYSCHQHTR